MREQVEVMGDKLLMLPTRKERYREREREKERNRSRNIAPRLYMPFWISSQNQISPRHTLPPSF